jgi:hypothetical protein
MDQLTRPVYGYRSDNPDASFECRLDSGPFEFCGPATYEVLEGHPGETLSEGTHTIEVPGTQYALGVPGDGGPRESAALRLKRCGDGRELGERGGEVINDLAGDDVGRWQTVDIFEGVVGKPCEVEVDLVASDELVVGERLPVLGLRSLVGGPT